MINDLDRSLRTLLDRELSELGINIYFDTPNAEFGPNLPAIDLFLYDIRENLELRSNVERRVARADGVVMREAPAAYVDCSYLITAWASDAENEHRILGEVMTVLLHHKRFPADVLQGRLEGQEPPARAWVLQEGYVKSIGELWQALGGDPRATLNYTITVRVPSLPPMELGPPVRERRFDITQRMPGQTSTV